MSDRGGRPEGPEDGTHPREAGLCATCRWGRVVRSRRSAFLRCDLSDRDSRFPRYPTLPVLRCDGYERAPDGIEGIG